MPLCENHGPYTTTTCGVCDEARAEKAARAALKKLDEMQLAGVKVDQDYAARLRGDEEARPAEMAVSQKGQVADLIVTLHRHPGDPMAPGLSVITKKRDQGNTGTFTISASPPAAPDWQSLRGEVDQANKNLEVGLGLESHTKEYPGTTRHFTAYATPATPRRCPACDHEQKKKELRAQAKPGLMSTFNPADHRHTFALGMRAIPNPMERSRPSTLLVYDDGECLYKDLEAFMASSFRANVTEARRVLQAFVDSLDPGLRSELRKALHGTSQELLSMTATGRIKCSAPYLDNTPQLQEDLLLHDIKVNGLNEKNLELLVDSSQPQHRKEVMRYLLKGDYHVNQILLMTKEQRKEAIRSHLLPSEVEEDDTIGYDKVFVARLLEPANRQELMNRLRGYGISSSDAVRMSVERKRMILHEDLVRGRPDAEYFNWLCKTPAHAELYTDQAIQAREVLQARYHAGGLLAVFAGTHTTYAFSPTHIRKCPELHALTAYQERSRGVSVRVRDQRYPDALSVTVEW